MSKTTTPREKKTTKTNTKPKTVKKSSTSAKGAASKKTTVKKETVTKTPKVQEKKAEVTSEKSTVSNITVLKFSMLFFGVIGLVVGGWLWWDRVYQNPTRVFWGMIENNLAVSGVTRSISKGDQTGSNDQTMSFTFGNELNAHNVTHVKRQDDAGKDDIITESVQTPTKTYVRYAKLDSTHKNPDGKLPDFSSLAGKWAVQVNQAGDTNGLNDETQNQLLLGGTLLSDAKVFVSDLRNTKVISIVPATYKREKFNGHTVYNIDADVNLLSSATQLESYLRKSGLNAAAEYIKGRKDQIGGDGIRLRFTIDSVSRQLLLIKTTDASTGDLTVSYSLQGVTNAVPKITTTLTSTELQKKLTELEGVPANDNTSAQ
jgi:hypothetical protein